jgi:hypothetical protein
MMARNRVLSWLDGRGWLILSGGDESGSEIRAQALGRISADGGVAYVSLGGDSALGERALADMDDLGAPSGYLVDVLSEDDETIRKKLSDAGMVVIESGTNLTDLRSGLLGAAADGMRAAYETGAIILAEGVSAAVFGEWVVPDSSVIVSGLGWVRNTLIVPGVVSPADSPAGQTIFKTQSAAIALSLGLGSALALGPDGEVETWGKKQVTLALGPSIR